MTCICKICKICISHFADKRNCATIWGIESDMQGLLMRIAGMVCTPAASIETAESAIAALASVVEAAAPPPQAPSAQRIAGVARGCPRKGRTSWV